MRQKLEKMEDKMKIGIDLGGSHIGFGVIENNNIIEQFEKDFTDEDKAHIIEVIESYIIEKVKEIEQKYSIESIGIAVPGSVKDGIILKMVNLGIYNYNIKQKLEESLNKPISVRNDAKCACIAEFNDIVKKNAKYSNANIVFLSIGTGIGGGVIYNGKLLEGHNFDGYEIGHMVIKDSGIPCKCGKYGCFERYGSILEYKNKVKQKLNIPQEMNGETLREVLDNNRQEILDINNQYVSDLALGISNLINIFEPDMVVLGGGFTHFSYMFKDKIKEALVNSPLLFNRRDDFDLRIAELGNDAGIIGATL